MFSKRSHPLHTEAGRSRVVHEGLMMWTLLSPFAEWRSRPISSWSLSAAASAPAQLFGGSLGPVSDWPRRTGRCFVMPCVLYLEIRLVRQGSGWLLFSCAVQGRAEAECLTTYRTTGAFGRPLHRYLLGSLVRQAFVVPFCRAIASY